MARGQSRLIDKKNVQPDHPGTATPDKEKHYFVLLRRDFHVR
jgi:hypothetical protein